MNQFIKTDIRDGIINLKAGISNAISDIMNKEEVSINLNIDTYTLIAALKGCGYHLLYGDNHIILEQIPIKFSKIGDIYIISLK